MTGNPAPPSNSLRQICFMIMPYGKKPTEAEAGKGPATVDFDALWEQVLRPLIEEDLGCVPVRADQDLGALIIVEMIERLALSDLVIADVTAPNANVYYEVGVRHAARERGCVLISADWSRQKFDLDQMRQLRYPLPDGAITDETAAVARTALRDKIHEAMDGISPVFKALPGYPTPDPSRVASLQQYIEAISAFSRDVREARLQPAGDARASAHSIWERHRNALRQMPAVALEVLYLLRDCRDWQGVVDLVDELPEKLRRLPVFAEQYWLSKSKLGNHLQAIAALEELIQSSGDSAERSGLIGGRYKKLYDAATSPAEKAKYLSKAIASYERGMMLDLNDFYPASNLPRLLRARRRLGDEELAREAAAVTLLACKRALVRDPGNEWIRPTLLGAAFDAGDVVEASRLYDEMVEHGVAAFHLDTTLRDLEHSVTLLEAGGTRDQLIALLAQIRELLPPPSSA